MVTQTNRWQPSAEQAACLINFSKNSEHFVAHQQDIKKDFAGQFIAILDGNVVKHSPDGKYLVSLLREETLLACLDLMRTG